ncbi:MAG: hypothetical protein GKR93_04425 [Gammaproteobacteria bacterium]|nr:hypothetical protein [Gammaproteobacteria bacterium]
MREVAGLIVLLFALTSVSAGEIESVDVKHHQGVYTLDLSVVLSSGFQAVYDILIDHEDLHRISDVLVETNLITEPGSPSKRRRLVTETCILFFCFAAVMVEDVRITDDRIATKIIPLLSDYRSGQTIWQIAPGGDDSSRVNLHVELEPAFWVPPVIGPYVMKKKMESEARKTIHNIEALAQNG